MYVFNLPMMGRPFLQQVIQAKDIHKDKVGVLECLQEIVGGLVHKVDVKKMGLVIHGMFCENEKWRIANQLLCNQYAKVYINDNGLNECGGNMAIIVLNAAYRVGGCPHLMGNVAITISQKVYEKICNKPLNYWIREEEEEEEDDE